MQQVYKVIKTEHVRKRPKWLMRFLIKIPTELYEETCYEQPSCHWTACPGLWRVGKTQGFAVAAAR